MIVDDFLPDFDSFRQVCDNLNYSGVTSPVDGVFYPGISLEIPEKVKNQVLTKLQKLTEPAVNPWLFLRLSLEGVDVPHQAHNDTSMGRYGMILYLNRPEHCHGGTSTVRHKTQGMENGPENDQQMAIWKRDVNRYEQWEITQMIHMQPNKAWIFPTETMHRAEKPSSYGTSPSDGRLVMVAFW